MITIHGNEYRNLEEQVQANKNDIERIIEGEELLARLGIKVVGQAESTRDLPNPVTYEGDYGDAYLIGTKSPYDYYIYTRPFEGETEPQWFNLGPFPVAGPKGADGAQGPQGPQGIRGSQWFSGTGQPSTTSGYNIGDYYINVGTGNIWHLHDVEGIPKWLLEGNITGPQGPQGIQGPKGDRGEQGYQGPVGPQGPAGPMVEIIGSVGSVSELEAVDITTYPRNAAFIQTNNKHVWIIMGGDGDPLYWYDAGVLNAGTLVNVNGAPQTEWNADTKLTTGASMTYSLANGLRVYKMDGNNRAANYASLRQDGIVDVRDSTKSSQLGVGSMTVNGGGTGNSTRYGVNEILTKGAGLTSWSTLRIPIAKSGTLSTTADIAASVNALRNEFNPAIADKTITSTSNYNAAGQRDIILLKPHESKIMILRANDTSKKWTFRYWTPDGEILEEQAQLMIAFIPSEKYRTQNGNDVYRPWIIKIDQGTIIPSVAAHTYDVRVHEYFITTDLTEFIIGEFQPPSDCATDVYELYQG